MSDSVRFEWDAETVQPHPVGVADRPCSWLSTSIEWRMKMAKKLSESSRPAKLINVSAASSFSKPIGKKQKAVLSKIAKRQASGDDSNINYSDIPALTDEQLGGFRRTPKVLAATRIDGKVSNGSVTRQAR